MARYVTVRIRNGDLDGRGVVPNPFTYLCPFTEVEVGDAVLVPFGPQNILIRGTIKELDPPYDIRKHATKWVAAHVNHRAHDMRMALGVPDLTEGEE